MTRSRALLACAIATLVACGEVLSAPAQEPTPGADATAPDASDRVDSSPTPDAPGNDACVDCPTQIATSQREINWVALDATRVLWMDAAPQGGPVGDLWACPKSGCGTSPTALFTGRPAGSLASDGNLAFASIAYGGELGVYRLDPSNTTSKVYGQGSTNWLTLRDGVLYMTFYGTSLERTISTYDTTTKMLGTIDANCTFPGDGTINTSWSVVTDQRIFLAAHNKGGIFACPKTGGSFAYYFQGINNEHSAWSMATDDAKLYWVDSANRLASCSATATTCDAATFELQASSPEYAGGIRTVVLSKGELFMETSGGDLIGCKTSGCNGAVKKLAHENKFAESWRVAGSNVAVDDNHIYYVARDGDPDTGTASYRLMRLPRKPL